MKHFILLVFVFLAYFPTNIASKRIITGDERTELYFNLIKNKRIALYSNHTGIAHKKHVVDLLIEKHMNTRKTVIFIIDNKAQVYTQDISGKEHF